MNFRSKILSCVFSGFTQYVYLLNRCAKFFLIVLITLFAFQVSANSQDEELSLYARYDSVQQCSDMNRQLYFAEQFFLQYESLQDKDEAINELNILVHLKSGVIYAKLGRIPKVWEHWGNCIDYLEECPESRLAAQMYFTFGKALGEVDAPTSILLFRTAMERCTRSDSTDVVMEYQCLKEIINLYVNTANDNELLQDIDLSAKYYSSIADSILVNSDIEVKETEAASSIYRLSSESLLWLGENRLAFDYVTKFVNNSQSYSDMHLTTAFAYMLYGVDAYISANVDESIRFFSIAIKQIGALDSYLNPYLEMAYAYLGVIYSEQHEYDLAIEYMEKSIKCLLINSYESIDDPFVLLPYSKLRNSNHAFNVILCLERMQTYYQQSLISDFSSKKLQDFYNLSNYTRDFIKARFLNVSSEQILIETARLLEQCDEVILNVMYSHFENFNADLFYKIATEPAAFYLRYLLEIKDVSNADGFEESCLLKEINDLTISLATSSSSDMSSNYVNQRMALIRAKTLLADQQKSHINILDRVQSLSEIQADLDDNTLLVKYLVSGENLYLIACTQYKKNVFRVLFADYDKYLRQVRKSVKTGSGNTKAQHYFYEKLISPLGSMIDGISHLHIINDASIVSLPFEVLQNEKGDFLVNKFNVKYFYSTKGVADVGSSMSGVHNVLAFAPVSFSDVGEHMKFSRSFVEGPLMPLTYSKEEVDSIGALCSEYDIYSEVLTGSLATKAIFKQLAGQADILHISTHGVNVGKSEKGLVFAGDSFEEQVLLSSELYGMQLNCSLVVLSACKTAVGEVARGEGVMALPRSFIYAGSPNVLAALWNIDDEKTTEFIGAFYEKLFSTNCSYSEALRETKLDCINKGWLPMDWAAFVLIGS